MSKPKHYHITGMGRNLLPDLAVALARAGHFVTGSDENFLPQASARLQAAKVMPLASGWSPEKITADVEAVVLAPGIPADNSEVIRALQLGVPVYSFPALIYRISEDKQRLVIAGSHGKTMIAAMVIHVLTVLKRKFDFVVTADLTGLDNRVRLSDAPLIVIESQDFLSSSTDPLPAMHAFQHHVAVIPGIEWQPSNEYPNKELYLKHYRELGANTPKGGALIYFELDSVAATLSPMNTADVTYIPYKTHPSDYQQGKEFLLTPDKHRLALKITGKHNFQNLSAALEALKRVGITSDSFYKAIETFNGLGN